ncbi:MAG: RNA polymerase sigma factor [Lachnospiraceae bacterium]|nr:RNA polymerase sigma factor [Lachnospiraceae bacterium]MBP5298390.1 RNA polymerase sigma factor [Lachnospiraceae bacterium]
MLNDDELYKNYLEGNKACGDELMLRYADSLTAYLNAFLKNMEDAEDLMLETFTVILVDKPKIGEGCFRAYLYKVARHKACRLWRKKVKQSEFFITQDDEDKEDTMESVASESGQPEDEFLRGELGYTVRKCLNVIAPQYREALWLIYGTGLNYEQAAGVLGCSRKRVDNLLLNGRKALKSELAKEGITYNV